MMALTYGFRGMDETWGTRIYLKALGMNITISYKPTNTSIQLHEYFYASHLSYIYFEGFF